MGTALSGRTVLIVEDEPIIALDISASFLRVGATVVIAHSLVEAKQAVVRDDICTAIVDFGLKDGDADWLCKQLNDKDVPFVLYSGYDHPKVTCKPSAVIPKPASGDRLVETVCHLLGRQL